MILNITHRGLSADYPLEGVDGMTDDDVKRVATEIVRQATLDLPEDAFGNYVVDRFERERIYLRPKVPFG